MLSMCSTLVWDLEHSHRVVSALCRPLQDSESVFLVERQHGVLLGRTQLALRPGGLYHQGPWSEWSPPLAWRETAAAQEVKGQTEKNRH